LAQNAVCLILLVVIVETVVIWARERSYKLCCVMTFLKAAYFLDRILSKDDRVFIVAYCTAGREDLPPSVHGCSVPSISGFAMTNLHWRLLVTSKIPSSFILILVCTT